MNYKKYELRELIKIKNGKDYKNEKRGLIPVYGTGGIVDYIDKYIYNGESILLPRKGSLDNIEYVNGKFWTIDTMYWTQINTDIVYGKFLFLYLSLLNTAKRNTGSTLPSMTFEAYYSLEISLPEYEKQKKIADFIFIILDKINNNNQINNNLEELMKTIYQRWFIEFEFPNEEGKPYKSNGGKLYYNDKLKHKIPGNWGVNELIEVADIYQPKTIPIDELKEDGKYNVYGANGIIGKYDLYNHEENEIAVCCRGAGCGKYIMTQPFSWITGNAMVIKPKLEVDLKEYIYYKLDDKDILNYVTGSAQPQITRTNIENMKIMIPDKAIINKFNSLAKEIRKNIINLIKENQRLDSLKKFILPLLINGQINVDDIEI